MTAKEWLERLLELMEAVPSLREDDTDPWSKVAEVVKYYLPSDIENWDSALARVAHTIAFLIDERSRKREYEHAEINTKKRDIADLEKARRMAESLRIAPLGGTLEDEKKYFRSTHTASLIDYPDLGENQSCPWPRVGGDGPGVGRPEFLEKASNLDPNDPACVQVARLKPWAESPNSPGEKAHLRELKRTAKKNRKE